MKNTIKLTIAIFFSVFTISNVVTAQSEGHSPNFSINFEGESGLRIGGNFEVNLYNGLTKQLKKDGLIGSQDDYHFVLTNDEVRVNGEQLKGRNFHKYQDIIRDDIESIRFFEIEWQSGNLKTLKINS